MTSEANQRVRSTRYTLLVCIICYIPHCITSPWWLFCFVLVAILYRLISDHYGCKRLSKMIQLPVIIASLLLLKGYYGTIISSAFYVGFLLTFIGLKITEIHTIRDLKVLVLCNFYVIFSALILIQELWIFAYLVIALIANFSLLVQLNAPKASIRYVGSRSVLLLFIALPLSIILFYLFPRLANPLWQVPSSLQAHTGFSDTMSPGSIAYLFSDDSVAFRVTFNTKRILNGYWQGLILNFYNGISWSRVGDATAQELIPIPYNAQADYEVLLEPQQQKWLFYIDYPSNSTPKLLFSPLNGLTYDNKLINQRFVYSIITKKPPYHSLTAQQRVTNTQLPDTLNPLLKEWAREHYARLHSDPQAFILFLKHYINEKPFWYSLSPPILDDNDQLDYFWFRTQKGFCEHYSSAVTFILRSVGIPARVIIGYQGGRWNPLASYLEVQQKDAHAWLEYWQEGAGWARMDPTASINPQRVESIISDYHTERLGGAVGESYRLTWWQRSKFYWNSLHFLAERWLLFYSHETQNTLLKRLNLDWQMRQLIYAMVGSIIIFLLSLYLYYFWWQRPQQSRLLKEYHLLQKELMRFNVASTSRTTLKMQCDALTTNYPMFKGIAAQFLKEYELMRLQTAHSNSLDNNKKVLLLLKRFRKRLKEVKTKR